MIIGITGNSGSGKSYISEIFKSYGYEIIDMDSVAHSIYDEREDCLEEIRHHFGDGVFMDGILKRKALGEIVFKDREKLELLNSITHKYIIEETKKRIKGTRIVIDAPVLIDTIFEKLCDKIILVTSDIDTKIKRIMERDNISYQYAMNRINSQPNEEYLSTHCDFLVDNSFGKNPKKAVEEILTKLQ